MNGRVGETQRPAPGSAPDGAAGALAGIRVLEVGQLIAGPLAGSILRWFGAEVVKIEPPGGDPLRGWRVVEEGTSLWWRSLSRGKRLLCIDLHTPEGQDLVRRLALEVDVLIENCAPGTLEQWGLDPVRLQAERPSLIVARVSGYGQTGPYRERRGFASVCEAFGGLRYVTGHPGETPVRSNLSLGDTLAAFQATIGILVALLRRERHPARPGETVDVAIYEAVLSVMESTLVECARAGVVREPSGTTITGVVPTDAYRCADGKRVVVGANADAVFVRLMHAIGTTDPQLLARWATNERRVVDREAIDARIEAWTTRHDSHAVLAQLEAAGVPASAIQSARDLLDDPHVQGRGVWEDVPFRGAPLLLPALGPHLVQAPGRNGPPGGEVGAHTREVLLERLGLGEEEIARLAATGVVGLARRAGTD